MKETVIKKDILSSEGITVLSLFDGISCGRIALERAGIKVKEYYASEIKKDSYYCNNEPLPRYHSNWRCHKSAL